MTGVSARAYGGVNHVHRARSPGGEPWGDRKGSGDAPASLERSSQRGDDKSRFAVAPAGSGGAIPPARRDDETTKNLTRDEHATAFRTRARAKYSAKSCVRRALNHLDKSFPRTFFSRVISLEFSFQ
jgi:hypothetical protein